MVTAVKLAFCFCFFAAFEQTVSWTIDLPQVRKYFFEKSLEDKNDNIVNSKIEYDNINTKSQHFDYEKYREHYANEFEYHGYMEQKIHDAVRNGSEYLEGLRRAIENYTRRLENCRRKTVSANIIQLRPNITSLSNSSFSTNVSLPTNFTINLPPNVTNVINLTANFASFMNMSANFTLFNVSDEFKECVRAERSSEHVRRLAELAIWAANELQDKLYADKFEKHQEGAGRDDTLILRLAWFLDRLAHLTGYDPRPQDFVAVDKDPSPSPAPAMFSLSPVLISNEDLQYLLTCLSGNSSEPATERCQYPRRPGTTDSAASTLPSDLNTSGSENHEYKYSEQDYADENMPLSLPPKPASVKTKRKRSVQEDPLQNLFKYYTKYKAWTGSNTEIDDNPRENSNANSILPIADDIQNNKRKKRFIVKKKSKHLIPDNPLPDLSSIVKHKIGVHYKKDKEEANKIKHILEKLHIKRPAKNNLKKLKKTKRSIGYMKKFQPKVPTNPQGDISYYVKNKEGTEYEYNVAQATLVRAGLEQAFQTGNIEVVRRYGSNYNPANRDQILNGYLAGLADV